MKDLGVAKQGKTKQNVLESRKYWTQVTVNEMQRDGRPIFPVLVTKPLLTVVDHVTFLVYQEKYVRRQLSVNEAHTKTGAKEKKKKTEHTCVILGPATEAFNDSTFQQTSATLSCLFQVHIISLILLISYCSARLQTELCIIQSYIRQAQGSGTEGPGNLLAVKRVRYHFNGTVSPSGLTFTGSCNDPGHKRGI